ncbi:MAG: zinc ribbon domain-containing protein [Clostridia bacterium]|nr:zinc ribbon domain-containing protein [Clostridia bacterium]
MAFFNRIGNFARNVSDKTGDKLEISKLKAQIRSNEDDIEELKLQLGDHIWKKFDSGVIMDEKTTEICMAIRQSVMDTAACRQAIDSIKAAQEAARYQAEAEAEARSEIRAQSAELFNEVRTFASPSRPFTACPLCGAPVADDSRFCGDCGTKLY